MRSIWAAKERDALECSEQGAEMSLARQQEAPKGSRDLVVHSDAGRAQTYSVSNSWIFRLTPDIPMSGSCVGRDSIFETGELGQGLELDIAPRRHIIPASIPLFIPSLGPL